jgi:hypothetical protein
MTETPSPPWQLAQLNVGRILAPINSPQLADFVNQLDEINALAEASPGFVWRLAGSNGNATELRPDDDADLLVNMSVWTSAEALFDFVYKSMHTKVMARRREWFEKMAVMQVLWWVPAGHIPTIAEAMARLRLLERTGPSTEAFTFKQRYPDPADPAAPGQLGGPTDMKPEPYCVA